VSDRLPAIFVPQKSVEPQIHWASMRNETLLKPVHRMRQIVDIGLRRS
jgi:hypothetical protein